MDELDSFYTVLNTLIGTQVTLDELDYLAKRLDSFDDGEAAQFQGMAHKLGLSEIKDLINLTFCCQKITCLLYTSPSPRDVEESRMPSSA